MAGHTYSAYNATITGSSVTITSSTATTASFTITDQSTGDGGILGDETSGVAQFTASKVIDSVAKTTNWTYLGTVTINGNVGFLAQYVDTTNNITNTIFVQNSTFVAPPSNSVGSLIAASTDSGQQDGDWNVANAAQELPCFVTGTRIATQSGQIAVERLAAGDTVLTASGAVATVRWIGRSIVSRVFADPVRVLPVRIMRGALGENLPAADLYVSPGHALVLDGLLVEAVALVNGTTIVRDTDHELVFSYYHVELDNHDVLLAEGVAAESFLDGIEELAFVNLADRPAREQAMAELDMPRVKSARQLPQALRARIANRAVMLAPAVAAAA